MDDELYHYGIKGMRWGIRRYQNPDGSLTPAGQKRADRNAIRDIKKDRRTAAKRASLLSDDELDTRIRRLQKEKQLRELTESEINPGRSAAKKTLSKYSNVFVQAFVQKVANRTADAAIDKGVDAFDAGREWVEWTMR